MTRESFVLFIVCLLAVGCSVRQTTFKPLQPSDELSIFSHIKKTKPFNTLKGIGSLEVESNKINSLLQSGRIAVAARAPHSFRIEFLNPVNQPLAVITANGSGYQSYYMGRIYKDNALSNYIPMPELKNIPFYIIGWSEIPYEKIYGIKSDEDLNADIIRLRYEDGLYHDVWLSLDSHTITKREVYDKDENKIATLIFGDYTETRGSLFPMLIEIRTDSLHLNVRYTKVEVNGDVSDEIFSLTEIQE